MSKEDQPKKNIFRELIRTRPRRLAIGSSILALHLALGTEPIIEMGKYISEFGARYKNIGCWAVAEHAAWENNKAVFVSTGCKESSVATGYLRGEGIFVDFSIKDKYLRKIIISMK